MSLFSQPEHSEAKLRIQGVEVPFIGASVSMGVNIPSTAVVHLIPTKGAMRIRPNTNFEVFYKDHFATMITGRQIYRILFEGEAKAISYNRSEGSKAVSVSCMDMSSYWLQAKQYYQNSQVAQGLGAAQRAIFSGVNRITGELISTNSRLNSFFGKAGEKDSFVDVVTAIMDDVKNSNEFFALNFSRLKMGDRVFSASTQKMTKSIFSHKLFQQYIKQQINKSGGVQSLWNVLNMLLAMVHHEIISLPNPSWVPNRKWKSNETAPLYWTEKEIYKVSVNNARAYDNTADKEPFSDYMPANFIIKPTAWMVDPPSCNIIFPSEVTNVGYSENWQKEITRLQLIPNSPIFKDPELSMLSAFYKPDTLQEHVRGGAAKKIPPIEIVNLDGKVIGKTKDKSTVRTFSYLSAEELERGIVPGYATILPGSTSFLLSHAYAKAHKTTQEKGSQLLGRDVSFGAKKIKEGILGKKDYNVFISRLADFEYHRKRASATSFSLLLAFKPGLVPGFPSIFIDDSNMELDIVSYVSRVNHIVNANGRWESNADFSLARNLDSVSINFDKEINNTKLTIPTQPKEPPLPAWFDEIFTSGQIGMHVYSKMLGCASLLNTAANKKENVSFTNPLNPISNDQASGRVSINKPGADAHLVEKRQRIIKAANDLRNQYRAALSSGNHDMFVYKKTFRPIATEEQINKIFYKGELKNASSYYSDSVGPNDIRFSYVDAPIFTGSNIEKGTVQPSITNNSMSKTTASSAKQPVKKQKKTLPVKAGKGSKARTGENFLLQAKTMFHNKDYVSDNEGAPAKGADCSGVTYWTAQNYFGVKLAGRRSIEMYSRSLQRISVEVALNTPGAIVFHFKEVNFASPRYGSVKGREKHVGISVGDGIGFYESTSPKAKIRIVKRRGASTYWTHAGLLPDFIYTNEKATGPGFTSAAKGNAREVLAKNYEDINARFTAINKNRWKIARTYQFELASSVGFEG